jgi:translation initiation factor 1
VKDGMIEIQGDHREILKVALEKRFDKVKMAGG